eukprot:gnl/MRDRNA2_/MRDRNA2_67085_c0_seq1.p1 gnl/MRDRNA2_/MRDRNA2_67085_c0~~gnl/MRDRNA2_/MRDRNA2_67085_c0_seq1.p1  ORF type:complete len:102 (-),score=25.90 gnl/MRDRNA2_/MRDRNA2_67085_c0_seq1:161-466(-)
MKKEADRELHKRLDILDRHLSKSGPYLLGKRFSLLDLSVAYWVMTFVAVRFMEWKDFMAKFPSVARMSDLVKERPKIAHKFDQLEAHLKTYMENQAKGKRW